MSDQAALPGERGVSPVAENRPRFSRAHIILIGLVCLGAFVLWTLAHGPARKLAPPEKPVTISELNPWEPATPKPTPAPVVAPVPPPPPMPVAAPAQPILAGPTGDPLDKARQAALIDNSDIQAMQQARQAGAGAAGDASGGGAQGRLSELAERLQPTVLTGAKATLLAHPEMVVTEGTLIPCTLITAMASDTPGFVTCVTTSATFSTTGTVDLLPRGTKIVGEYRSDMRPGQSRIFVVWDRAETPDHVIINVGSPGTDALGRNGFDGQVDNHWLERFGAALMFTLIDSGAQIASSQLSKNGQTSINFSEGQSVADTSLQNQINIPPTITKNQGESVAVMVGRDLDFSDVYGLTLRR